MWVSVGWLLWTHGAARLAEPGRTAASLAAPHLGGLRNGRVATSDVAACPGGRGHRHRLGLTVRTDSARTGERRVAVVDFLLRRVVLRARCSLGTPKPHDPGRAMGPYQGLSGVLTPSDVRSCRWRAFTHRVRVLAAPCVPQRTPLPPCARNARPCREQRGGPAVDLERRRVDCSPVRTWWPSVWASVGSVDVVERAWAGGVVVWWSVLGRPAVVGVRVLDWLAEHRDRPRHTAGGRADSGRSHAGRSHAGWI